MASKPAKQKALEFPAGWGGQREGAGAKPKGKRARVSHHTRAPLAPRFPMHVTMRLRDGLPSLRQSAEYAVLLTSFWRGCERFGMRLGHFSVQSNHLHLIVEGQNRRSISSGIGGLAIRIARGLNKLWDRTGKVFADRYHDRILRGPREVWYALRYVLNNARKRPDPYSSGRWFTGWKRGSVVRLRNERDTAGAPLARTRSYLLNVGWRCLGLLRPNDSPASSG